MHCDQARATLLDHLDAPAPDQSPAALQAHLESCEECRTLKNDLLALEAQARVWHDVEPPPWNPDPGPWRARAARLAPPWLALVQQWLPLAASAAALLLAVSLHLRSDPRPDPAPVAAATEAADTPTAQALLAASRRERQQEMEALTALLKAEMDQRSLETEQSLRYIIAHQIQSQRELDAVRGRLLRTEGDPREQL